MERIIWFLAVLLLLPILALAFFVGRALLEETFPDERKIWAAVENRIARLENVPNEELSAGYGRTVEF